MCVEEKWHASLNMLTVYVVFSRDETTKNFKCVWLHECTNNEVLDNPPSRTFSKDKRPFRRINLWFPRANVEQTKTLIKGQQQAKMEIKIPSIKEVTNLSSFLPGNRHMNNIRAAMKRYVHSLCPFYKLISSLLNHQIFHGILSMMQSQCAANKNTYQKAAAGKHGNM